MSGGHAARLLFQKQFYNAKISKISLASSIVSTAVVTATPTTSLTEQSLEHINNFKVSFLGKVLAGNDYDGSDLEDYASPMVDNKVVKGETKMDIVVPQSMLEKPATIAEAQSAAVAISSSETFQQLLPQGVELNSHQKCELIKGAIEFATNPRVIEQHRRNKEILDKLYHSNNAESFTQQNSSSSSQTSQKTIVPVFSGLSSEEAWREMVETSHFKCAYCLDLRAAPVVIEECSHSYCGVCINELVSRCVPYDNDGVVMHKCPTCSGFYDAKEIEYHHNEDAEIQRLVAAFSEDCEGKREWSKKRENYFTLIKEKQAKERAAAAVLEEQGHDQTAEETPYYGDSCFTIEQWHQLMMGLSVAIMLLVHTMRETTQSI